MPALKAIEALPCLLPPSQFLHTSIVSYCFSPEGFLWQVGLQIPGSLHSEDSLQPIMSRSWGINIQLSHSLLQPQPQGVLQSLWRDLRGQSPRGLPGNLLIKDLVDWARPPPSCPIPEEASYEPSCLRELPTPSYTALELSSALASLLRLVLPPSQRGLLPSLSTPTLPHRPQCP